MKPQEMNIKEEYKSRSNSTRVGAIVLAALVFALFAAAPPAIAGTVTYDYDDAGRLVEADYGNRTIGYEYDDAGNLLEKANLLDVETATGTGSASFGTEEGVDATIEALEAVAESALPEEGKPNIEFTHGFFSFNITGLTPGQTVNVTIELPADVPVGDLWWKVNTTAGNNTWYSLPIGDDDGDNTITITLTDGGAGDNDGAANGVIRDPGGPGGFPIHNLDTGLDYMTIQAAIDDANTTGGHTITVDPGTYSENVRVTKSLTLRSTSGDCSDTVVTAADAGKHVFNLTTNGVNVSGFTIEDATGAGNAGIFFGSGVTSCNVTNNNVKLNYYGVSLAGASDNNITCNRVYGNTEAGFHLTGRSTGNTIEQNNILTNGEYNDTSGGREWQFANNQSDDVDAIHNWWGTDSDDIINASIRDWDADPGQGNVTFLPKLGGESPCAPGPFCDCGDICVNTSGWWCDSGAFNASGTPIQAAADNATAGETICVQDGTYTENVDVNKQLTIRSENGPANCIVAASDSGDYVFNITADYVNIAGLTVENATGSAMAGIYLYDADNCRVTENNVTNNENGIRLNTSSDTIIADNIIHHNLKFGIEIHNESNTNRVENNTVHNHTSCWNGLGIGIFGNSQYNHVYNNTVHDNTVDNIELWSDAWYNTIEKNRCYNSEYGILVTHYANHNRIIDNELYENDYGIGMGVINESWGSPSPVNNSVCDNRIHDNTKDGIFLDRTDNNSIYDNNCSSNGQKGIHLNGSSNNTIYNNYFDNTHNAWDDGTNVWNITKTDGTNIVSGSYLGGNYWSDYAGSDTEGEDGLGDTALPYNCSGNITNGGDRHPLIPADDPSPCYIATATYGTPLDGRIDVLRDFRDNALMTNPVGEAFVSTYYATSPPIADALRGNDGLRTVTRLTLITPLVHLSKFLLNSILATGVFIIGLTAVLSLRKERMKILRSLSVGLGSILVFIAAIFSLGFIGYTIPFCAWVGAYLLPFVIPVSLGLAVGAVWSGKRETTSSSLRFFCKRRGTC